jgi:hypothetical protein
MAKFTVLSATCLLLHLHSAAVAARFELRAEASHSASPQFP